MIDEKKIIKKIENRIDTYIKEYPEKKKLWIYRNTKRVYTYITDWSKRAGKKKGKVKEWSIRL